VASTPDQVNLATAQYGTWLSYSGSARVWLAIIIVAVALGVAYAAVRLPLPVGPASPSRRARRIRVVAWVVSIPVLLVCASIAVKIEVDANFANAAAPTDPITPVTLVAAGLTFFILLIAGSEYGGGKAFAGAVIGAMAAPMIFELPFDLIVMARTYPAVPPDPVAWRVLFFAPLFLVEITTLALLTLSPLVRLSRSALFGIALMLGIFAVWGAFGFAYPSSPLPITLNVVSKLAAFAAALSLFLPRAANDQAVARATTSSAQPQESVTPEPP
jgi:hypothetical protein